MEHCKYRTLQMMGPNDTVEYTMVLSFLQTNGARII
jgi:hypothetical protein